MAKTGLALHRIAPLVIGALAIAILLLVARSFVGSGGFAYDYQAYDAAARRIATGQPLYPPGVAEAYNSGEYANLYLYPPPLAVMLLPVVFVGSDLGALIWLAIRLALLVAGTLLLPVPRLAKAALLASAAISFPVWYDLNLGNLSIVLFSLSCLVWRYRGSAAGGIALAVAGVLRYPFGIVLLSLAVQRRWRPVLVTIVAGLAIALATLPFVGLSGWLDYVATLRSLGNVSAGEHNLSFATTAHALGIGGSDAVWVAAGIVAAAALTLFAAARRDPETATVVALAATILCFPFFHPHYLVQLLIPAAFLAGRGQWWGLALPLLGWLPGELMAPAALLGTALPLLPPRFLAISRGGERLGGATGFGTGPARP
jgi:hypothetical protein